MRLMKAILNIDGSIKKGVIEPKIPKKELLKMPWCEPERIPAGGGDRHLCRRSGAEPGMCALPAPWKPGQGAGTGGANRL